jgi:hypothetical protein
MEGCRAAAGWFLLSHPNIMTNFTIENNYGYIPDEFVPEDVLEFNALEKKYDPTGQPTLVSWNSLEPFVQEQAETMDNIRSAG